MVNNTKTINMEKQNIAKISTKSLKAELEVRSQRSEVTKEIIKYIAAATAVTLVALLAPNAASTIFALAHKRSKKNSYQRQKSQIKQTLARLRDQKIISMEEAKGKIIIKLTENGQKRLLKYKIDSLLLPKPNKWDSKWRIVLFDVPEDKKVARDCLRGAIKRLGMLELQHSAWVFPYKCKNEIDFIAAYYGIGKYLLYLETNQLENEKFYLRNFNINR